MQLHRPELGRRKKGVLGWDGMQGRCTATTTKEEVKRLRIHLFCPSPSLPHATERKFYPLCTSTMQMLHCIAKNDEQSGQTEFWKHYIAASSCVCGAKVGDVSEVFTLVSVFSALEKQVLLD